MKYSTLALFMGAAATKRLLPAMPGYDMAEGTYCR